MAKRSGQFSTAGLAYITAQQGKQQIDQAIGRTANIEQTRSEMERLLGSRQQIEGEFGDPRLADFTQRVTMNEGTLSTNLLARQEAGRAGSKAAGITRHFWESVLPWANDQLQLAEEAAQAGNWTEAAKIKEHVTWSVGQRDAVPGTAPPIEFGFEDSTAAAKASLQGPLAEAVGSVVFQGKEFLDRESGVSTSFRESLTTGTRENIERGRTKQMRALAAGSTEAKRSVRDLALSRGGARNFAFETSARERIAEGFAGAQANIHLDTASQLAEMEGEVARYFETFSREFAANAAQAGQAFLNNESGIRDTFVQSLNQLTLASSEFANSMSERSSKRWMQTQQLAAQKTGIGSIIGKVVGAAAGAFTGGIGTALGSAIGGAVAGGG